MFQEGGHEWEGGPGGPGPGRRLVLGGEVRGGLHKVEPRPRPQVLSSLLAVGVSVVLVLTTGLTPLLVLGHITAVPYIFFLGVLPARTLRRAIHDHRPNRMLWWVAATWTNLGLLLFLAGWVRWQPGDARAAPPLPATLALLTVFILSEVMVALVVVMVHSSVLV